MANGEKKLLETWSLRLGLVAAIVAPTITGSSAYYALDGKIQQKHAEVITRISSLELDSNKAFAEKSDLKEMQQDIKHLREDVVEIKTMLKRGR